MAINTGGYGVSGLRGINLLDPRLLTPDYTSALQGVNQGLETVAAGGRLYDAAAARRENADTRAQRIAAANARNKQAAASALAEFSLLPGETELRRARTGADFSLLPDETQLRSDRTLADIGLLPQETELRGIRNRVSTAQGLADLPLIPRRASVEGQALDAQSGDLAFNESQRPLTETTKTIQNRTKAADAAVDEVLQPDKAGLEKGKVDAAKFQQEIAKLQEEGERLTAEATAKFMKDNPNASYDKLTLALRGDKMTRARLDAFDEALKDAPDALKNEALAGFYKTQADIAQSSYIINSGGVPPARGSVDANLEFQRRQARNNADLDTHLRLGDARAVSAFTQTPEGKIITDYILQRTANKAPVKLTPAQSAYIEQFRSGGAGDRPLSNTSLLPSSTPIIPAPVVPAVQEIPVLTPEQARAAPAGTRFRTQDGRIIQK